MKKHCKLYEKFLHFCSNDRKTNLILAKIKKVPSNESFEMTYHLRLINRSNEVHPINWICMLKV